jgi:dihydroflavonol-4-reductase
VQEEELLIKPAVQGTENVLSAVNATPSVERVVVTSSTAAVFTDATERGKGHVFTEQDWNISATPSRFPYFYSKKMAEQVRADVVLHNLRQDRSTHHQAGNCVLPAGICCANYEL